MDARTALAEALANEMSMDLTPQFMAATDRVLIRLYLHGYIITQGDYNDAEECTE